MKTLIALFTVLITFPFFFGDTSSPCARTLPNPPAISNCPEEAPNWAACVAACREEYDAQCQEDLNNACSQATALVQDYLAGNITMVELSSGIESINADLTSYWQSNGVNYQWCVQQCCE